MSESKVVGIVYPRTEMDIVFEKLKVWDGVCDEFKLGDRAVEFFRNQVGGCGFQFNARRPGQDVRYSMTYFTDYLHETTQPPRERKNLHAVMARFHDLVPRREYFDFIELEEPFEYIDPRDMLEDMDGEFLRRLCLFTPDERNIRLCIKDLLRLVERKQIAKELVE